MQGCHPTLQDRLKVLHVPELSGYILWHQLICHTLAGQPAILPSSHMEKNSSLQDDLASSSDLAGKVSTRGRPRIYSDRKAISLRLSEPVHQRMTILCDELEIPFNTYITELIKADLKKRGV